MAATPDTPTLANSPVMMRSTERRMRSRSAVAETRTWVPAREAETVRTDDDVIIVIDDDAAPGIDDGDDDGKEEEDVEVR